MHLGIVRQQLDEGIDWELAIPAEVMGRSVVPDGTVIDVGVSVLDDDNGGPLDDVLTTTPIAVTVRSHGAGRTVSLSARVLSVGPSDASLSLTSTKSRFVSPVSDLASGKHAGLRDSLTAIIASGGEREAILALYSLARAAIAVESFSDAAEAPEALLSLKMPSSLARWVGDEVYWELAWSYVRSGDTERAREAFEAGLDSTPGFDSHYRYYKALHCCSPVADRDESAVARFAAVDIAMVGPLAADTSSYPASIRAANSLLDGWQKVEIAYEERVVCRRMP